MLKIRNGRDFVGGLTMILAGLLFVWFGRELQVGNSFQMGPGYFPIMLSVLLMVIGVVIIGQSIMVEAEASEPEQWNWKAYAFIVLGPVGFGLLLSQLGLAPATFLMVVAVATASRYANWRHSILLGLFPGGLLRGAVHAPSCAPHQCLRTLGPFIGELF